MVADRRLAMAGIAAAGAGLLLAPVFMRRDPSRAPWPTERAIRLVVPFAAGGPTDMIARMVAEAIAAGTGARVYVESRPGAGGNIAFTQVAQSEPDGYTLLVSSNALLLNPWLYDTIGYDPLRDFDPVVGMLSAPNVFFASPASGLKSIPQLVAAARSYPDQLNYASPGMGTTPQLAAELLKVREKISVAHVVFGGSAPASQAVMAGDVQAGCVALPGAHAHIQAGKLVGLALTGEARWHELPDMPTMVGLGYDGFVLDTAFNLMAPAGLSPRITATLAKIVIGALGEPGYERRLRRAGFQILARGPADLKARIAAELPMWQDIVAQAGLRPRS